MNEYIGKLAIYPAVDVKSVQDHAVVFCETFEMARFLCDEMNHRWGMTHHAYLVLPSWPDPLLVTNLNCAPETVWFSTRDTGAAVKAAAVVRTIWEEADRSEVAKITEAIRFCKLIEGACKDETV